MPRIAMSHVIRGASCTSSPRLSTQLQEVKARGEQAIRADVVAREHQLNARQGLLVDAFMREKRLTLAACELLLPEVNRRTLQRDLQGLVAKGLIREVGRSTDPTRHYGNESV